MIPGMIAPSVVATCHPKHHRIERQNAYFHKINSHFAKLQYLSISLFDLGEAGYICYGRTQAWTVGQTKAGPFVCPSDTPYEKLNPLVLISFSYDGSSTLTLEAVSFSDSMYDALGRTNYLGVAGYWGRVDVPNVDFYKGIFFNRSKTAFRDIKDGSSNTLLFGEAMGGSLPLADGGQHS